MKFKPRRSSPRLPAFDYRGEHVYHLILTTRGRTSSFRDERIVADCLERLQISAAASCFKIAAYYFMPDHLHLLAAGDEYSRLIPFMQHFKQATSYRHSGLWQRSFYDHILRSEEAVEEVARYIWANPVRAGLTVDCLEFPFSGPREAMVALSGGNIEDRAEALSLQSPIRTVLGTTKEKNAWKL